jgi:hypothetical protein
MMGSAETAKGGPENAGAVVRLETPWVYAALHHGLAGALLGYVVLHPIAMLIQTISEGAWQHSASAFVLAFSIDHLPMAGYFAVLGIVLGVAHSFYVESIRRKAKIIEILENFLPICCACKKIRTPGADPGLQENWKPVELYITQKTGTLFSHGICPECSKRLYPED